MPVLSVDRPVTQAAPELLVENRLAAGRHRFALVVRDTRGAESEPHVVVVTVRGRLEAVRPAPQPRRRPRKPK